jgi:hypothetical protein
MAFTGSAYIIYQYLVKSEKKLLNSRSRIDLFLINSTSFIRDSDIFLRKPNMASIDLGNQGSKYCGRCIYFPMVYPSVATKSSTVIIFHPKIGQIKFVAAFFCSVLKPAVASDLIVLSVSSLFKVRLLRLTT